MKTKVWIVIWGLKDGGAETLAKDYARLCDKQAFETTVVTMYPFVHTANYKRAMDAGLKICSIFKRRNVITRAVRILLGKWYVPAAVKKMLEREMPDTIHFNDRMAFYFTPLQRQLSGKNLLYTCHNEVSKHFFDKEEEAVRQLIREPGLRLIALHEDMKQELDQRFEKENTVVIRNGVDLQSFREAGQDRSITRQRIGISPDAYIVGHIGRFSYAKNHVFLLKVFQQIAARNTKAYLLLVGDGELRGEVTQEIQRLGLEDRVTMLSHRADIPDLLHAMDVMVFPSFHEGLSVTLVEAQASGLKCVVSDAINPANFMSERTIPVSLAESADTWADIALNDAEKHTPFGKLEEYDINREIHRLERLYQGQLDV